MRPERVARRTLGMRPRALVVVLCAAFAVGIAVLVLTAAPMQRTSDVDELSAVDVTGSQRATACDGEFVPVTQAPESTPKDAWRQGSMPYLYQIDPQYRDVPYSGETLEKQGCGPTALSMVYVDLTGDASMGPAEMAAFSTANGYSTEGDGSSWLLVSKGAEKLGLSSSQVAVTPDAMATELGAGRPLICVMGPGTFTKVGHFIAIEGLDGEGKAIVHDSNSRARSLWRWDLSTICAEAQAVWSFSAA